LLAEITAQTPRADWLVIYAQALARSGQIELARQILEEVYRQTGRNPQVKQLITYLDKLETATNSDTTSATVE
jgi:thioredoxin-like negative regulator of GroEL